MKKSFRFTKRLMQSLTAIVLVFVLAVPTFASSFAPVFQDDINGFAFDDVMTLEPYVYVVDGVFMLDFETALANGISIHLLKIQQQAFDALNQRAYIGEIVINDDLTIDELFVAPVPFRICWASCGGGRNDEQGTVHWWGVSRYLCDCNSREFVADLGTMALIGGAGAAVGALFGVIPGLIAGATAAWVGLVALRIEANNQGLGVYLEVTWALIFSVTTQLPFGDKKNPFSEYGDA